jgi:8-oxo-dGTP pyrophosphatase MutT (NUDIX family)
MPHVHEKIDFTVGVFIVHRNTVLLRRHDKYKLWMGVGGHIELDEDPIQAAAREAKEEVGIDIILPSEKNELSRFNGGEDRYVALLPPPFLYKHTINDRHVHINSIYFARAKDTAITQTEGREKSDEIRWFTKEELNDPKYGITDMMKYLAEKALDALSS